MKRSHKLFKGLKVRIHSSWFLVFLLFAWLLQQHFSTRTSYNAWVLGFSASLFLFLSVLAHELSHSLVARRKGLKVSGITLFFFGGVSVASERNLSAEKELRIALAGPLASLALGGVFFLASMVAPFQPLYELTNYLFRMNVALAVFNLLPGYPLDGGRVLRALMWKRYGLLKATQKASRAGQGVAALLIATGLVTIQSNGWWIALIGLFLYSLAKVSLDQARVEETLSGKKLRDFLKTNIEEVSLDDTVESLAEALLGSDKYFYAENHEVKLLNFSAVEKLPRKDWPVVKVREFAVSVKPLTLRDTPRAALKKMAAQRVNMLPVVKGGEVVGVVLEEDLRKG